MSITFYLSRIINNTCYCGHLKQILLSSPNKIWGTMGNSRVGGHSINPWSIPFASLTCCTIFSCISRWSLKYFHHTQNTTKPQHRHDPNNPRSYPHSQNKAQQMQKHTPTKIRQIKDNKPSNREKQPKDRSRSNNKPTTLTRNTTTPQETPLRLAPKTQMRNREVSKQRYRKGNPEPKANSALLA